MKLHELDMATLSKAVAIYLELAYGVGRRPGRLPDLSLPADATSDRVLALFQREVVDDGNGQKCVRYNMRLGNRNYPFMKLVLQEHLVEGEYCFAIDAHDEMNIKPDFPDYEAWMAVRRFNQQLKRDVEARLQAEGLPTAATIRKICGERAPTSIPGARGCRILIVDDEEDLAFAAAQLLRARGYEVDVVHDGKSGVLAAARLLPSLVLLDYELPEMDGLEVIATLRAHPMTAGIPVVLSTASRVTLEDIGRVDGFLQKPFPEVLLYEVIERALGAHRGTT
jgi:CheY-like chemotaxis protein